MSNTLDKYAWADDELKDLHEEAAEDAEKGEQKDARDDNDKIGRIHDALSRIEKLLNDHFISKQEAKEEEKTEAKDEEERVEEDRKEEGSEDNE